MSDYGSEIYGDNNVEEVFGDDGKDVYGDFQNETLIFGETFDDTQKQTLTEGLNARSQKDKHFLDLKDELLRFDMDPKYIDDTIVQLRESKSFPFLNAKYVANGKYFLSSNQKLDPSSIDKWVTNVNKQFGADYLNKTDFYRYILICQKLFKK